MSNSKWEKFKASAKKFFSKFEAPFNKCYHSMEKDGTIATTKEIVIKAADGAVDVVGNVTRMDGVTKGVVKVAVNTGINEGFTAIDDIADKRGFELGVIPLAEVTNPALRAELGNMHVVADHT